MHTARGKLLFIGTGGFVIGILCGTVATISWFYLALSIFISFLSLLLAVTFSPDSSARAILFAIGLIAVMFPIGEVRAALAPHGLPAAFATSLNQSVSYTGTITDDPDIRLKNQQLIVSVSDVNVKDVNQASSPAANSHTNILVFAPLDQNFAYGEQVRVAGTLTAPTPFVTDTGRTFRYDQYLSKKGVFATVSKASVTMVRPPAGISDALANMLFAAKHTFTTGLSRALPDPYAELATGLLTGDQHSISDPVVTLLVVSGLIWIVVLSGYHITLIANGIFSILRFLPRSVRYIGASLSVLAIIFATGGSAPSIRGGFMACLTLFAQATYRQYDAFRALCVAVICILLLNPFLLAYDSGFQLSILVTPAILFFVPRVERKLIEIKMPIKMQSAFLREVIAVSVVAQLACMPLILWQTGQISPWAIPANLLVMPLVPFSMAASFTAGIIGVAIQSLAPLAGLPAYYILSYMLWIAKAAAKLPLSSLVLPEFSFIYVIIAYALLTFIALALTKDSSEEFPTPLPKENASRLLPS